MNHFTAKNLLSKIEWMNAHKAKEFLCDLISSLGQSPLELSRWYASDTLDNSVKHMKKARL